MRDSRQLPQKREEETSEPLTWAKWGLMGIGAVVVAGWALSLLSWMFPLLVVGAVGYGAWKIFGPDGSTKPKQLPHVADDQWMEQRASTERSKAELQEFDRRLTEAKREER